MAKRKGTPKAGPRGTGRKTAGRRKSVSRPRKAAVRRSVKKGGAKASTSRTAKASVRRSARTAAPRGTTRPSGATPRGNRGARTKATRLDRERRRLEEMVPTPPSSLNMRRHGSSARTGRHELAESIEEHTGMTPTITGGDVDADWEGAYFSGDEAPGGDNPTPDQDIVDDIGKSLGVEYQDNEELKSTEKVTERDKHRWELDPASSEDYKDRD